MESLSRSKNQAVAMNKDFESRLIEMSSKIDDAIRQLTEANTAKSRLAEENLVFSRRIETLEFELVSIQTAYKRAQADLEDARVQLESEMAVRVKKKSKRTHLLSFAPVLHRPVEHYNRR